MKLSPARIAVAVAAGAVLLGGGTAASTLALAGHSAPVGAAAAPSPHATPKPPAKPAPPRPATPVRPHDNGTHNTFNGPVTIINQAPQPSSTVYVPIPAYAPAYVTSNQGVVQQYYADLNNHDYAAAWALGGSNLNGGSGYDAWVAGYATTSWITLDSWDYYPGYNAVGVTITAGQSDGTVKTYSGSYTVSGGVITSASITQASGAAAAPTVPAGLRYVGGGVYANAATSDSFALAVHQAYVDGGYWNQPGTSQFWAYSSTTGQSYLMTSSSVGNPVVVTGGNGALVQFSM